jgi:hypothetical protein
MSGHWSDAPPDRIVTMPPCSKQQPVLLDPGYGVLRPLTEVAPLTHELDVSNVVRSTLYQRDYMVSVISLSQLLATGGISAFVPLLNQQAFDLRECVLTFCFFSPRSTVSRIRSGIVLVSGGPGRVMRSRAVRILFSPFRDAHFFAFWISLRPGYCLLNGLFSGSGIPATAVDQAAFHADHCADKSLRDVPVDAWSAREIPLSPIGAGVFACDKRAKKRQTGESQSGAPIARKVRGVVALERCHASSFYIDGAVPATGNGGSP